MQTKAFKDEAAGAAEPAMAQLPITVVVAYDDLAAGKRAMRVLAEVARAVGDDLEFQPIPWSFNLLADRDWREVAASEMVKADMLIIATSGQRSLPSEVGRWTEAAIQQKRGRPAAVVALFGPEDNPDPAGSPRLEYIQRAAREAGLQFFAPTARSELIDTIEGIHRRADAITPVLAQILHQTPKPTFH